MSVQPAPGSAPAKVARTLGLATPFMQGHDVRAAQHLLAHNSYGNFHPGEADGQYGPLTANATERAKVALGFPAKACDHLFDATLEGYLQGNPLPPDFATRRKAHERAKAAAAEVRTRIVANGRWGAAHEPQIHYAQTRPIDGRGHPHKLPLTTDCSGFVTDCYQWAGAPDPNGNGFNGQGFTGTLLSHCRHIPASAVRPGDLVVWGPGTGEHVALVLEPGSDPVLVSHGQEKGPIQISFSAESAAHHPPVTWLTCLD
jgi:cell wall-associated NlpC family hydrolase